MCKHTKRTALFPGTFDPPTNGHVDIIRRGADLFDELIVAIGENPGKACLLDQATRAALLREVVGDVPNVRVETFRGLTVEAAKRFGASVILRGVRNGSDFQFECEMAMTNREVAGVETFFLLTSPQHCFTSSSLIKQIARMGGDASALVPHVVLPHLLASGEE